MPNRMFGVSNACYSCTATAQAKTLVELIGASLPTNHRGGIANSVLVKIEDYEIRVRFDGSSPNASVGIKYSANESFILTHAQDLINKLKIIRCGSNDTTLTVHFFESEGN